MKKLSDSRLLIISNMSHYLDRGVVVGHGPTAREISHIAALFREVRHIAFLHSGLPPRDVLPYDAPNLTLIGVPPSGGISILQKVSGMLFLPIYSINVLRELHRADVVHVRAPANLPMLALFWLALTPFPKIRWYKYAGSWELTPITSWFSSLQRRWLRLNLSRGIVTINGTVENMPSFMRSFYNPCLTDEELKHGYEVGKNKEITQPIRVIFVGRLDTNKGINRALRVIRRLVEVHKLEVHLDVIGQGDELLSAQSDAERYNISKYVQFHGNMSREQINNFYAQAHFVLLPSATEGWPKVLSEAMAYGGIPIASQVGSIKYYLNNFSVGQTFSVDAVDEYADAILDYIKHPMRFRLESTLAMKAAKCFSYRSFLEELRGILETNGSK